MASAQESGTVKFVVRTPSGNEYVLLTSSVEALGPSGSPDGVIGSTPEKWLYQPIDPSKIPKDSRIYIYVKLQTADGIDWSDCALHLPMTMPNGRQIVLVNSDFTGSDLAAGTTAGVWHELAYYDVTMPMHFGGGKIYNSIDILN